jgi:hypothetical protein
VQQQLSQVVGGGNALLTQHQLVLHGPGKGAVLVRCLVGAKLAACMQSPACVSCCSSDCTDVS